MHRVNKAIVMARKGKAEQNREHTLSLSKSGKTLGTDGHIISQLTADDCCITEVPVVVTHCAPRPVVIDLHSPLHISGAIP